MEHCEHYHEIQNNKNQKEILNYPLNNHRKT